MIIRLRLHTKRGYKEKSGFAKGFHNARKKSGLTQEEFSETFEYKGSKIGLDTVKNWEQGRVTPPSDKLIALADFFNVSVDYLLGRSECTSVENEYIRKKTGLNDSSIKVLQSALKDDKIDLEQHKLRIKLGYESPDSQYLTTLETLNIMFEYSMLVHIAKSFKNFLNTKYKVPVYYDNEKNKWIYPDSGFVKLDGTKTILDGKEAIFPDEYMLNLASSETHPSDYISFCLSDTFLDTVSLKEIEGRLYEIRNLYREKKEQE